MHWLLLARTIVTGQAGAAETGGVAVGTEGGDGGRTAGEGGSSGLADDSANPTGARDDSDDDDDDGGGGSGAGSGVGGGGGALIGYMGVAVQTRQVAAAAAITGTTANYGPGCPPRWQVKHAAVQLASQALSIAARHARLEVDNGAKNKNKKQQYATIVTASCHMDVAMARASVASALAAYGNPSTSTYTSSFVAFRPRRRRRLLLLRVVVTTISAVSRLSRLFLKVLMRRKEELLHLQTLPFRLLHLLLLHWPLQQQQPLLSCDLTT